MFLFRMQLCFGNILKNICFIYGYSAGFFNISFRWAQKNSPPVETGGL